MVNIHRGLVKISLSVFAVWQTDIRIMPGVFYLFLIYSS